MSVLSIAIDASQMLVILETIVPFLHVKEDPCSVLS